MNNPQVIHRLFDWSTDDQRTVRAEQNIVEPSPPSRIGSRLKLKLPPEVNPGVGGVGPEPWGAESCQGLRRYSAGYSEYFTTRIVHLEGENV